MPKGEKVLAQSKKDRTTTNHHQFSKFELRKSLEMMNFSIDILILIEFQIGTPSSKTNI
jgi:tRNA1(Val) A37 N6-methylase TrmN6